MWIHSKRSNNFCDFFTYFASMEKQIIECVPNFSEGRDLNIIKEITNQIESVEGVHLLDVDPGHATNRTVVTFVGSPEEVIEAAFIAVKKAAELIDMSKHNGEHPRFGATDVCPLVPISGITMEETVVYARKLAKRVGEELGISVYCYENAAYNEERKNLAYCRSGEYEGLKEKLMTEEFKPDFGPSILNVKSGATAIGARDFLIAYNVNLNTTSTRRANAVAFDVRERGRVKREGNKLTGKIIRDSEGNPENIPGCLKAVKAIGWYIEEYGIAQISMNLTNVSITSVHEAFDAVCEKAQARGLRVSGSELVGLMPLKTILDAGRHYLKKQERSVGISDSEIIKVAVKSMGLDELGPFNPNEKIIEYKMAQNDSKALVEMSLEAFSRETASESPAPGGGSISAYVGSLGAALGTMVANLSAHKRGWDDRWEEFSNWAENGKCHHENLCALVDEDTKAFNKIMDAFALPKSSDEEKAFRKKAIENATRYAIEIPFRVMKAALGSFKLIKAMAEFGNPNSVSDAGVGALCARAAVIGAYLNVKINSADLKNDSEIAKILDESALMVKEANKLEAEVLDLVYKTMEN